MTFMQSEDGLKILRYRIDATENMASNTKNDLEHGSKGKAPYTVQIERSEDLHELSDPDEGRTDQERAAIVG